MNPRTPWLWLVTLVLASTSVSPAQGQATGACSSGPLPAATLLVPYFEVDLGNPTGPTTFYSVQNTSPGAVVVRNVLWTNWGLPTLAFDVFIDGRGSQSIDLRDILADGHLPVTGPPESLIIAPPEFPDCTSPLTNPVLDAGSLATLRARHLGQPDPEDGFCYSTPARDPQLAVGYVTVDVLNRCSETVRYPGDEGYFVTGGLGVASNRNLVAGDFFLMDRAENLAQGFRAVSILAAPELFDGEPPEAASHFYEIEDLEGAGQRAPLGTVYQARFLNGGAFDGGTDLILWHGGVYIDKGTCGAAPQTVGATFYDLSYVNESVDEVAEATLGNLERARRIEVGTDDLPVAIRFGTVQITGVRIECAVCGVPSGPEPLQMWAASVMSAEGRFSVGYPATRIDDLCP